MTPVHVAVVPEFGGFNWSELTRVSAALQQQVSLHVAPLWGVNATVDAFQRLEDVPPGYWPLIITTRDLGSAEGTHKDRNGQPFALVQAEGLWSIAASHECIEMIVDPLGTRHVLGPSPISCQTNVEFLIEVCDPCQPNGCSYTVNDVPVSDFVTPAYYQAASAAKGDVVYSFNKQLRSPFDLVVDGYLSWRDTATNIWWQRRGQTAPAGPEDRALGLLITAEGGSVRETINRITGHHLSRHRKDGARRAEAADQSKTTRRASLKRAAEFRCSIREFSASVQRPRPELEDDGALRTEIERAIDALSKRAAAGQDIVLDTLHDALAQVNETRANAPKDLYQLSVVRTAIRAPQEGRGAVSLTSRDVTGLEKYDDLDVHWLLTLANRILRHKAPFSQAIPEAVQHALPASAVLAVAGDWGTGDQSSLRIADLMKAQQPTHTVHLGDVYYSGTESEELDNLVAVWPRGSIASFALNSNHEMYSGGNGYFGVALTSETFEAQGPYSYFVLTNDHWAIIGIDSAYYAENLFQDGRLINEQVDWLAQLRNGRLFDGKKIMVLSHHHGLELSGERTKLWADVATALGRAPDYWYWGHVHGAAVFHQVVESGVAVNARLAGHGGIPYIGAPKTAALSWTETRPYDATAATKRSLNGFVVLRFDGPNLVEEFWDENGTRCNAFDPDGGPASASPTHGVTLTKLGAAKYSP